MNLYAKLQQRAARQPRASGDEGHSLRDGSFDWHRLESSRGIVSGNPGAGAVI